MIFGRRDKLGWPERLRTALWPRRTWSRSLRYVMLRVRRLAAEPHAVALGFACGAFVSFLPFMGLHFILAALCAWALRGSIVASALGTFVGNPVTFPLIWISTFELGRWILAAFDLSSAPHSLSPDLFERSFDQLIPLLEPMTAGAVPLGLMTAATSYLIVKRGVEAYQTRRLNQFGQA